jgi:hypothetical protein
MNMMMTLMMGGAPSAVQYYFNKDMLRSQQLRPDYEIPLLKNLLRMQKTSLTIWPQIERTLEQEDKENIVC